MAKKLDVLTVFLVVRHVGCVLAGTVGAVDVDYLVYTDSVLDGRANLWGRDNGLVDMNGLLVCGTNGSVDGGLGYSESIGITRPGSSTVLTLDMVDGALRNRGKRLRAMVMAVVVVILVVVTVGVDLDMSIRESGTRRSA